MFRPLCIAEVEGLRSTDVGHTGQGSCPSVVPHTQMVLISNNFHTQHLRAAAGEMLRVDDAFYQH